MTENTTPTADFSPSKRFFVSMLTRDIDLNDAILDLLDNCVDGALRTIKDTKKTSKPYEGFYAKLTINKDVFIIEDNCGGIPKSFREYAFKMGRPHQKEEENEGTVGVYGIGMKRAIFKMGRDCSIQSNNPDGAFTVDITPDWIDGDGWKIPMHESDYDNKNPTGTTIEIKKLHSNVAQKFNESTYLTDLFLQIKHSLSFIIQKGFKIELNGVVVEHNPINIITDHSKIEPYIYKAKIDDVDIDLVVGFYKNLEDDNDDVLEKRSSDDAGWTVICNDRVVLYCDKTHLTGWGFANVPRFHTQFIAISGVVRFTSKNPEKLPITTTKRGVDLSSTLYNDVRNKMIEGMMHFIRFTNQWKGEHLEEGKKLLKSAQSHEAQSLFEITPQSTPEDKKNNWSNPNRNKNEWRYTPKLPTPVKKSSTVRIIFTREKEDVKILSKYFFGHEDASASDVGMQCFDTVIE
ncbi:ATP-binding protein, partial [Escherichia coli]|nr:ATPase [Escherichia coli]EIG4208426.1 ATP-binding protein [Escherichia coli]EJE5050700.1 ATP-binding protein [Escherichia coli]